MLKRKLLLSVSVFSAVWGLALNASAANNPAMLEPCFMANVALYLSGPDLKKFRQINKTCEEGVMCLRRAPADTELWRRGGRNVETVDFSSFDEIRRFLAAGYDGINSENIKVISLSRGCCDRAIMADFLGSVVSQFPNIKRVEVHGIDSEALYSAVSKGIITCGHINFREPEPVDLNYVTSDENKSQDSAASNGRICCKPVDMHAFECTGADDRYSVFFANTMVRIDLKSISEEEEAVRDHVLALKRIFPSVAFFRDSAPYKEGMPDREVDHVLDFIYASPNQDGQARYDMKKLLEFIKAQYDRRRCPFVSIYGDKRFNSLMFEDLLANGLIEVDEHGSVSEMKWFSSVTPIGSRPISWIACQYDHLELDDESVLDITVPESRGLLRQYCTLKQWAKTKILYADGRPLIARGNNVPLYAELSPAFFDMFFDYSNSEIVVSEDIEGERMIKFVPKTIGGSITFCGNRPEEEKHKIRDAFAGFRSGDGYQATVIMQGVSAPVKVRKDDLYYSGADVAFPDLVNFEDEVETAIKQYELFENERVTFDKNFGTVLHNSRSEPTFRYIVKKVGRNIILQLSGVPDGVYEAPNKRLVIHNSVREIDFEPKAGAGLTFVLPCRLSFVNERFWQAGNSYVLGVYCGNGTLNYLESIKEQHDIDISDRPDKFGYWHISKKMPA